MALPDEPVGKRNYRFPVLNAAVTNDPSHQQAIYIAAQDLEALIQALPPGRHKSLALTHLETSMLWVATAMVA